MRLIKYLHLYRRRILRSFVQRCSYLGKMHEIILVEFGWNYARRDGLRTKKRQCYLFKNKNQLERVKGFLLLLVLQVPGPRLRPFVYQNRASKSFPRGAPFRTGERGGVRSDSGFRSGRGAWWGSSPPILNSLS